MKNAFAIGVCLAAIGLATGTGGAAYANDVQDAAAGAAEDQGGIGDIVVTAQRRGESLQRVPIAVTALTSETLTARGVADIRSLTTVTPGLQYNTTTNISLVFLRGVGTENLSLGDEPSVATYVDGVYYPSAYGSNSPLPDVERIEVLKGPQGTLFGRNALGGVINVVTRTPSQTPTIDARISYGRFDTVTGSVYASTGIAQNLAVSFSAYYHNQDQGFGRNLTTGNDIFKSRGQAYRAKLVWEPSALTKVTLAGYYDKFRGDVGHDRRPLPGAKLTGGTTYQGFYNVENTFDGFQDMRRRGGSLTWNQDLGFAELVMIGSLQKMKDSVELDQDGTPAPLVRFSSDNTYQNTRTAELQLQSPSGSKVTWILGAYYFNDLAAYQPLRVVGAFTRFVKAKTESVSAFGQLTYPISDAFRVTGGLRYTHDDRSRSGYSLNGAGVVTIPFKRDDAKFSKLTWRLSADYDVTDDVLAYLSYNRGFKSGIFNTVNLVDPVVRPEVLDAYEVGFKSKLFDNRVRLNGAFFYYDHKDIQSSQFNEGVLSLINAARGRYYGAELEAEAALTRSFRVQVGAAWERARYKSFPGAPEFTPLPAGGNSQTPGDATDNHIIRTPEFTANVGLNYETRVGDGTGYWNASYYYNDGFYWKPDNRTRQQSYNVVNATIGWRTADDLLDISFWGKNIFSEKYYIYGNEDTFGDTGSPAAPATYGATLRIRFGG